METKPSYQLQNTFTNKNKYKKSFSEGKKVSVTISFQHLLKKIMCQKMIRALTE